MKKFILVMVFILLTALFIAFNYLLWDRESKAAEIKSLENTNVSHNASISAQKREIDSLAEEVGSLSDQISQLENEKNQLIDEKNLLAADRDETKAALQERIEFINILKQYADINALSEPVKKWAEALNQGNYEEAYRLEYAGIPAKDRAVSISAYVEEMKSAIRKIEITDVKVDKLRGTGNGDIYLDVRLNVKLAEEADKDSSRFSEGDNDAYIRIDYSADKKEFVIYAINNI